MKNYTWFTLKNVAFYIAILVIFTGFFGNFITEAKGGFLEKIFPSLKKESTLNIEAGVVFQSGKAIPLSRTTFSLLDKGFAQTLIDEKLTEKNGEAFKEKSSVYVTYAFAAEDANSTLFTQFRDIYNKANLLIKPHVIQSVTTDFSGKAVFKNVPAGKYYLTGVSFITNYKLIWDAEINLSPGDNSFVLDQSNTAIPPMSSRL